MLCSWRQVSDRSEVRLREKPLISREKGNREVVTSETNYLYNRYKGLMPLKLGLTVFTNGEINSRI